MQEKSSLIITTIFSSTIIIFIFNLFIIYIIIKYKRFQLKSFHEFELNRINLEKDRLKIELEIQEETLAFVSREIHDNICLSLTLAKLHLNTYIMDNNRNNNFIEECITIIGKSITDLNDLSKSVDGEIISKYGLIYSLNLEIDRINKSKIIDFRIEIEGEEIYLDSNTELMVFRIIQEGINNILKHSKASKAKIQLKYLKEYLIITLIDNGVGIIEKKKDEPQRASSGIKNMEKRAKKINGNLEIYSEINNGTTVIFSLPIKMKNE